MTTPDERPERQAEEPPAAADATKERDARRRTITGYATGGVLLAALVASVVLVAVSGQGDNGGTATASGFEPEYTDLDARREAAGVSTMSAPAADAHFHPRLTVYANNERVPIPVNIGIDPSRPEQMASLHTHESDGTIHVEGMAEATLGQLFEIWGVPFSRSELGPYRAQGAKTVRMWVDGEPSTAFGDLQMEDGQEIVVAYGTDAQIAEVSP